MDNEAKMDEVEELLEAMSRGFNAHNVGTTQQAKALLDRAEEVERRKNEATRDLENLQAQVDIAERAMAKLEASKSRLLGPDGSVDGERLRARLDRLSQAEFDQALVIVSANLVDTDLWEGMSADVRQIVQALLDQELLDQLEEAREEIRSSRRSFAIQVNVGVDQAEEINRLKAIETSQADMIKRKSAKIKDQSADIEALQKVQQDLEAEVTELRATATSQAAKIKDQEGRIGRRDRTIQGHERTIRSRDKQIQDLQKAESDALTSFNQQVQGLSDTKSKLSAEVAELNTTTEELENSVFFFKGVAQDRGVPPGRRRR
ncbi:hypothetical protein PG989_006529 [Apiospora arundinis]